MHREQRPIGFLAEVQRKSTPSQPVDQVGTIITFDSGDRINFADAAGNVMVTGATGRGKTTGAVVPMLDSLISAGFGGIAIDVKGNFSDYARSLARRHGREQDILELGTGPQALPFNIFNGLSLSDLERLVRSITLSEIEATNNLDWHLKGVKIVMDMLRLLLFLSENQPALAPNMIILNAMLNDYRLCRSLMRLFLDTVCNDDRHDHVLFRDSIKEFAFTPLMPKYIGATGRQNVEWETQIEWNLQSVRRAFGLLLSDPRLQTNFCSGDSGFTLDFGDLVYRQNKIVLLRFDPQTTSGGSLIAKFIKEKFYQDVYANGLKLAPGKFTFAVMDEFQDIVDLNPMNPMSDAAWLAKAREFRNINVMATQSFSSLYQRTGRSAGVDSMLNNCSTKILMQMDDPMTNSYLSGFPALPLFPSQLDAGRCLLFRFDTRTRRFVIREDGTQGAYESGQAALGIAPEGSSVVSMVMKVTPTTAHLSGLPQEFLEMVYAHDPASGEQKETNADDLARESREKKEKKMLAALGEASPRLRALFERHRSLFDMMHEDQFTVPPGWIPLAEWFLSQAEQLEVPIAITSLGERDGSFFVTVNGMNTPIHTLVREARRLSETICMFCGGRVRRRKQDDDNGKDSGPNWRSSMAFSRSVAPVCTKCKIKMKPRRLYTDFSAENIHDGRIGHGCQSG